MGKVHTYSISRHMAIVGRNGIGQRQRCSTNLLKTQFKNRFVC